MIITSQIGDMYWILSIMQPENYNSVIMMIIAVVIFFSWVIHIWKHNAFSTPELPIEPKEFE